jgi:hypothetical protein
MTMIVVTGDNLLDRDSVEKLRSLVTDVQLIGGTRGVLSMFSARQPAPGGGLPEPIFSGALAARIGLPSTCRAGAAQGHHPRQAAVDRRPTGASQVRQREKE